MADKIFLSGEGLELIMSRFLLCKLTNQTLLVLASPLLDLLLVVDIGIEPGKGCTRSFDLEAMISATCIDRCCAFQVSGD